MREIRRWARLTAYCLLVALQPLLTGCETPPPEAALREAVAELESGLEGGDVGAVMDRLAKDFRYRDLDRKAAGRRLVGVFLRYPKRQVSVLNVQVSLDPVTLREAEVTFNALVWGGRATLPEDADSFRVRSRWREEGGDWVLVDLEARGLSE